METLIKHESNTFNKITDDVLATSILKGLFEIYSSSDHFEQQTEFSLYQTSVVVESDNYSLEFTSDVDFEDTYKSGFVSYFHNIQPTTIFIDDETELVVSTELIDQIFNA